MFDDFLNCHACLDGVSDPDWRAKIKVLVKIRAARPWQFRPQNGRNIATREHAVRNPALKSRLFRKFFINVQWIIISRNLRILNNVGLGYGTNVNVGHANLEIIDKKSM